MTCSLTRKKSNELCKNSQDIICSNAGTCLCGRCKCDNLEGNGLIHGKYCECDDRECIDEETGEMCTGHGKCYCGNCYCEPGWHGDKCELQCDITPWEIKKRCTSPDGKICSNRGMEHYRGTQGITGQVPVYAESAHVMTLTQQETGEISMETLVSAMNETARQSMTDTQTISVQVRKGELLMVIAMKDCELLYSPVI
uniref:Uncharacterized protein n=1 Tax=Sphaerodactylus townsendi TaxID=933632 RepID=A0ACB8FJV5_9SAUR